MSISDEINRINTNIKEAFNVAKSMGALSENTENSNNLPDIIRAIPKGFSQEDLDRITILENTVVTSEVFDDGTISVEPPDFDPVEIISRVTTLENTVGTLTDIIGNRRRGIV